MTVLLLVGGAPGTGKSTLASNLAVELGWPVIRSDDVRRELPGRGEHTYDEMYRRAESLLAAGASVILDATFASSASRVPATSLAVRTGSRLRALRCTVSRSQAAARIKARRPEQAYGSAATPSVALELADRFDPWAEATRIDTRGSAEMTARLALVALRLWQGDDQRP